MKRALFVLVLLLLTAVPGPAQAAPGDLAGKTICLDPGHGGSDPGAVNEAFGLRESDINLDVAFALKAMLGVGGDGATVVMTRDADDYKTNSDRYTFCNAQSADILISVHTNSTTNSTSDGSLALYFKSDDQVLAQAIYDMMYPQLRDSTADPASFAGFGLSRFASGVLLKSHMPATIVEPVFMSNLWEAEHLVTPIGPDCVDCRRAQIADAIHAGVLSYFGTGDGGIVLTATGYIRKRQRAVDLAWSGAAGDQVQVYRDGALLTVTANDGAYTDSVGGRGGGSFSYKVCQTDGATCSNLVTVIF